jgi:hypothetical protein
MEPAVAWPPIKIYSQERQPEVIRTQLESNNDAEIVAELRQRVAKLSLENDVLCKVVMRLRAEVRWQIRFWDRGMQYGIWESMEATKRRLSRLRGALLYLWPNCPKRLQAEDEENMPSQ